MCYPMWRMWLTLEHIFRAEQDGCTAFFTDPHKIEYDLGIFFILMVFKIMFCAVIHLKSNTNKYKII